MRTLLIVALFLASPISLLHLFHYNFNHVGDLASEKLGNHWDFPGADCLLLLVAPLGCSRLLVNLARRPGVAQNRSLALRLVVHQKNILFGVGCIGISYNGQPMRWVESLARASNR